MKQDVLLLALEDAKVKRRLSRLRRICVAKTRAFFLPRMKIGAPNDARKRLPPPNCESGKEDDREKYELEEPMEEEPFYHPKGEE